MNGGVRVVVCEWWCEMYVGKLRAIAAQAIKILEPPTQRIE